jgi:hypothetical protein
MSDEHDQIFGDPAIVAPLFKEFNEWHRLFAEDLDTVTEKAVEMNKQIGAFHERQLLVSIGTIGISLSALISLGTKISINPAAKHIFVFYVAPAWVLLFMCVWACRNVMAFTLRINKAILEEWANRLETYHLQQVTRSVTKLSKAVHGTVIMDSTPRDLSAVFADLAKLVTEQFAQQKHTMLGVAAKSDAAQLMWQSRIAVWTMFIGLSLLCIAAIKLFLQ